MDYKQSEILFTVGNVSFAAIRFGETDQFMSAIAISKEQNKWVVSRNQPKMTSRKLQKEVQNIIDNARLLATKEFSENYISEIIAYVKNLPDGHRSNYLESVDPELYNEAVSDIKAALEYALTHVDSFRAAVEFESRVPYLIGNRDLVITMEDLIPDFQKKYEQEKWIIAACEMAEDKLRKDSSFTNTQISEWKKTEGLQINSI